MTAFRIKEYYCGYVKVYAVQGHAWFGWTTIKEFSAKIGNKDNLWWARACAENLLDELQKEQ